MYERPYLRNPIYQQSQPYYGSIPVNNQSYHHPYEQVQNQTPFEQYAKPKQPANWYQNQSIYSSQDFNQPQQFYPPNSFLSKYQDDNGQLDFDKMLATVGQIANTYHQVSPIIKQFSSFMKTFR